MANLKSTDYNTPRNSHKNLLTEIVELASVGSMMDASTNNFTLRVDRSGLVNFVGQIQADEGGGGIAVDDVIFTLPNFVRPLQPDGVAVFGLGVLLDVGPITVPFPVFILENTLTGIVECRARATATANGALQFNGLAYITREIF